MELGVNKLEQFNTQRSLKKDDAKSSSVGEPITGFNNQHSRANKLTRVSIIRAGIPYESIEVISKRLNNSVKSVLEIVGIPQTTYNKKKSKHSLLDSRNTELVILINELIDFGMDVFNNEQEKFQRWLKKPNISLGGNSPESMLDTFTGINEVKFSLNRLEFGNLA